MTSHYLLSCAISADIRQSVQIKFDDLKLPKSVIDTLKQNNTVSIRPNLSNALKTKLDSLRVLQRELYDCYCIHYGDSHFVTSNYFHDANKLINEIKCEAKKANEELAGMWEEEFAKWEETTERILRPLFTDEEEYKLVFEAYMRIFPTKQEYRSPIRVSVLGPLPVSLQAVDKPDDETKVDEFIAYENSVNTQAILEAAKHQAADRALIIGAELIDDLDYRPAHKVGKQQTGSDKKRGSWEITANKLKLIADSVPGFDNLADLAEKLLEAGRDLQHENRTLREKATKDFYSVQETIKKELEEICNVRDSSKGLEKLKTSISLSTKFKQLCDRIKTAENVNALNLLLPDVNLELDIYEQRGKQLKKLLAQRKELIHAAGGSGLDELISEVANTTEEPDF
jgi:hypothetical protein